MLIFEAPLVRVRRKGKVVFQEQKPVPGKAKSTEMARTLALGHRIVMAVEQGDVISYTDAGKRMGLHQERISVLVTLTFLAPDIQ